MNNGISKDIAADILKLNLSQNMDLIKVMQLLTLSFLIKLHF